MSKNIQIPADVFFALCDFFCDGGEIDQEYIKSALEVKRKAVEQRTMYSLSKNKTLDPKTREHFRQEYLNAKGVPQSFRYGVNYEDD